MDRQICIMAERSAGWASGWVIMAKHADVDGRADWRAEDRQMVDLEAGWRTGMHTDGWTVERADRPTIRKGSDRQGECGIAGQRTSRHGPVVDNLAGFENWRVSPRN